MSNSEDAREKLLREIVEREMAMLEAVPTGADEGTKPNKEILRLMRSMIHSAHENAFLKSYLEDLRSAEENGRNFMLEQYSRMNNQVNSPTHENILLDQIVDAEMAFQDEAAQQYPDIIRHKSSEDFRRYLRAGLESLSSQSLELYSEEMRKAKREGRNPVLERHNWFARKLAKEELSVK